MAVTISASTTAASGGSTQHVSSFTATNGQPYAVFLAINPDAIAAPILSVTYKSSTLTSAGTAAGSGGADAAYIWTRADGAGADGSSGRLTIRYTDVASQSNFAIASFAGAHASAPFSDYATSTGASTNPNVNVANMTTGDLALVVIAAANNTISSTGGASQVGSSFIGSASHFASVASKTGTGTLNVAFSQDVADGWAGAGIRVVQAAGGGGGASRRPNQMTTLGVA